MKNVQDYVREQNGKRILAMKNSEKGKETMNFDGYMNLITRYGTAQDSSTAYTFSADDMIPDTDLTEQYVGNGLFAKIMDAPAEEAVKLGYDFGLNDPNVKKYISDELDTLDWEEKAATAIKWTRLYGGAVIVMLVDDGCDLDEPLDWDEVEEIEELRVYERAIVQPDTSSLYDYNPEKRRKNGSKFQKPEYYFINSKFGQFRVHESRCLIFQNGSMPETGINLQYLFFGIPEFLRIQTALRETIVSHSLAPKMLERCIQGIYKMQNLADLLATDDGTEKVLKRLEAIDLARGLLNSMVIDSEGEDYDFKNIPLSGVKDIIDGTCNMLSAVTNIPQTILFGRSPAGENSTGESDMENYYNYVNRIQKKMLKKNLRTIIDIILRCGQRKGKIQEIPSYKVDFVPLWSLSEEEQANVDAIKATTEQTKAATAQVYVDMQVLDPSEVRAGLKQSDEYTINDLLNEEDDLNIEDILGIDNPKGEETVTEESQNVDSSKQQGVGVLVIQNGKILVAERTDGKGLCGPGGHIELGESPEMAAIRETEEEFGIMPIDLIPLGITGEIPPELESHVFLCTNFVHKPRADNEEMRNACFMSLEEIHDATKELFAPFEDSIRLLLSVLDIRSDEGNSNSGNHNHKGRPGQLGGSGGGGSGKGKPLSAKQRKEYADKIVGQKTSKGVTIKEMTKHICDRCGERRISAKKVMEVLQHPETVKRDEKHSDRGNKFRYKKGRVTIVVDHDNGEIVTVFKH